MKNILNKFKVNNSLYVLMLLALICGYIKRVFLIMTIIVIHELGHVFFICLFKMEVEKIEIYPFGGVTVINKRIHERIYKELIISMGGIIFQLFLFILFRYFYDLNIIVRSTYLIFLNYNKSVLLFNLLPIIPLDGSKFVFSLLSKYLPYKKSYKLMIVISMISLLGFITYNVIFRLNDLIIYLFLIIKLVEAVKDYKFIINKFYLERLLYNHYYDKIISDENNLNKLKLNKLYYFYDERKFINEKEYIRKNYFS